MHDEAHRGSGSTSLSAHDTTISEHVLSAQNDSGGDDYEPENDASPPCFWYSRTLWCTVAAGLAGGIGYLAYRLCASAPPNASSPSKSPWLVTTWSSFVHYLSLKRVASIVFLGDSLFYKDVTGKHYVTGILPGSASWLFDHIKSVPTLMSVPATTRSPFAMLIKSKATSDLPPDLSNIPLLQATTETNSAAGLTPRSQGSKYFDADITSLLLLSLTAATLWGGFPWINQFGGRRLDTVFSGDKKKIVLFSSVVGHAETKQELRQLIEFLKHPQKIKKLGARIPRGVLLEGRSGTGKTLLARAVAGEAGVPFFYISAASFVEVYVGQGASRVRQFFQNARRHAPCVVFVDEIDALGTSRSLLGHSNQEYIQTLNQLLTEMDGLERDVVNGREDLVVVMAATNRYSALDEALIRPGRFDKIVTLGLPTLEDREELCRLHSRHMAIDRKSVKFPAIAQLTEGWTGAEIECLFNETALLTARKGAKAIQARHVAEVLSNLHKRHQRHATSAGDNADSCAFNNKTMAVGRDDWIRLVDAIQCGNREPS